MSQRRHNTTHSYKSINLLLGVLALDPNLKIPFFRIGRWKHPLYGNIEATQEMLDSFVNNFRSGVLGRPPYIRIGHDIQAATIDKFGDAPAEAWVYDIRQEGDVLYAYAIPTNYRVVDDIQTKRYRFASAEYDPDYTDKETGQKVGPVLSAIALTNEPFLTKLPDAEAIFLSDQKTGKTTFILDYEEADDMNKKQEEMLKEQNSLLKKLSDSFTSFFSLFQSNHQTQVHLSSEQQRKLSEYDALVQRLEQAEKQTSSIVSAHRQQAIEMKLSEFVAQGIPPVVCEKAKEILLSSPSGTMIKLSDTEQKSLDDAIFDLLKSFPEENRVKFSQYGQKAFTKPGVSASSLYADVVPELQQNQ